MKTFLLHCAFLIAAVCVGLATVSAGAWLVRSGDLARLRAPAWAQVALPSRAEAAAQLRQARADVACAWARRPGDPRPCSSLTAPDAFPLPLPPPPPPDTSAPTVPVVAPPSVTARIILRGQTTRIVDATGAVWSIAPARNGSVQRNGVDLAETMNVAKLEYRGDAIFQTNDRGGVWRWIGPMSAPPGERWRNVVAERPILAPPTKPPVDGVVLDRRGLVLAYEDNFDALTFDAEDSRAPLNGRLQTWMNNDWDPRRNRDNFWSRTLHHDKAEEDQYYVDPYILARHAEHMRGAGAYNPFSIVDGALRITARRMPRPLVERLEQRLGRARGLTPYQSRKAWASGVISTHESFAQRYGVWEARMRLPAVRGMWPAFWMLNEKRGWPPEIDIVDNFHSGRHPDRVYAGGVVAEGPPRVGFGPNDDATGGKIFPFPIAGVYHTFTVDWGPDEIIYFVDDVAFWREPTPATFHDPMFVMINLAVVGPGNTWADQPAPSLQSASMDVDWVRVWRRPERR